MAGSFREYKPLLFLTQLGWSVICPLVAFPLLGVFLMDRLSLGVWVVIVCVALGIWIGVGDFLRLLRILSASTTLDEDPRDVPPDGGQG